MNNLKNLLKKLNVNKVAIVIGIVICILGIIFIYLSLDKSEIFVKERLGAKVTNLGYCKEYGADFYTEMSLNTKYIASATRETYYHIERCFGVSLIIIGIFYILHNFKQLKKSKSLG